MNSQRLLGKHYLEIPESNKNIRELEIYKKIAKEYDVEIIFLKE